MTSEQARDIVDGATHNAVRDVRARRTTWIAFVVLLASIIVAALWFGPRLAAIDDHSQEQDRRITEITAQADKYAADGQALRDQVVRLGGTPVVEPAQPGATGATGATGPVGPAGRDGVTPPCMAEPDHCRGPAGATGAAGADGKDGTNGQNGQSPPCLAEPAQCRGADGRDGQNGRDGADGAPGPTCPDGYELRDAVITAPDGTTYSGKACVDPSSSSPPSTNPPLPIPGGS